LRAASVLVLVRAARRGFAQYPEKPIRFIVPVACPAARWTSWPARSPSRCRRAWGNRSWWRTGRARLLVGTQAVAKAAPDGYTLLTTSTTFLSAPAILANPGYDPVRDFVPVSITCRAPMMVATHPSVPAKSLAELVALARAKPGEVTTASSGNGSTGHMAAELFARRASIKFNNIFYKGRAQALTDVIGGQTMMLFDQIGTTGPHARSGKLRPIAVTTLTRCRSFPICRPSRSPATRVRG
jgi:tripartite-type tricarboxylate transporter receptor subunit TctC